MTQKTDEYLITLTRENAKRVAKLAEDMGYQDDCQYLEDILNRIIEQRYEQMELVK